ncbi:hypothetical protein [Pacificibacter sp. AS14]|uniref:hypothetical protein n=1 Tax=Pacificibacter sp. AS14 TaxID=3135785 RepID=UPI0031809FD4
MTYFTRLIFVAVFAAFILPTALSAQQNCAKRDQVIARLASKYGEVRQSIGLAPNSGVFEIYASQDTGSWTILVTNTNGISCLVASGQAFEILAEVAQLTDEDA